MRESTPEGLTALARTANRPPTKPRRSAGTPESLAFVRRCGQKAAVACSRGLGWWCAALACAALATGSPPARADEPERPLVHNPEAYPPSSAQTRLLLLGTAVLAGWYVAAVIPSYSFPHAQGARELRYPVVGPWMSLAESKCETGNPHCDSTVMVVIRAVLTALDGVGQAGGLALAVEGAFMRTAPTSRTVAAPKQRKPSARWEVRPVPLLSNRGEVGVGLAGRF
jgi:hypothetical protein